MNQELKIKLLSYLSVTNGEKKLYDYLIFYGIGLLNNNINCPEVKILELYNAFYFMYLTDGDKSYLIAAEICRKAAHKLYRTLLKKGKTNLNYKFLNIVK